MKTLKQRWIDALHDLKWWTMVVVIVILAIIVNNYSCSYVDKERAIIYYDQEVQHFPETNT